MPEILRSATLSIEQGIHLPMSPPIIIIGRGKDGKAVCQLHINATGVVTTGPRGAEDSLTVTDFGGHQLLVTR